MNGQQYMNRCSTPLVFGEMQIKPQGDDTLHLLGCYSKTRWIPLSERTRGNQHPQTVLVGMWRQGAPWKTQDSDMSLNFLSLAFSLETHRNVKTSTQMLLRGITHNNQDMEAHPYQLAKRMGKGGIFTTQRDPWHELSADKSESWWQSTLGKLKEIRVYALFSIYEISRISEILQKRKVMIVYCKREGEVRADRSQLQAFGFDVIKKFWNRL